MYLLLHLQLPLVGLLQVLLTLLLLPQRLDVHVEVHHVALDLEGQMLLVCGHNARLFLDLAGVRDLLGHQPPLRLVLRGRLRPFAWSMQIACRCQVSNFAGEGSRSRSASP